MQGTTRRTFEHGECPTDVCLSASVALVGAHEVEVKLRAHPTLCTTSTIEGSMPPIISYGSVTYADILITLDTGCAPGTATGHLIIDGFERDSDFTVY